MNLLKTASSGETTGYCSSPLLVEIALATPPAMPLNRKKGMIPVA